MLKTTLQCGRHPLDLSSPQVMGVLNVTPDSFSDGGHFVSVQQAVAQALTMVKQGASIVDVGGESTRPGAEAVSEQQELDRVIPVVESIIRQVDVVVSVDTSSPLVMRAAAEAGAGLLNDVRALSLPGALQAAQKTGLPVCLMHMQGQPKSMQDNPRYRNVNSDIYDYLCSRVAVCVSAGISRELILLDPGFGFGKSLDHNLALLNGLPLFSELGFPLLVGLSRKSMIGAILNKSVEERLHGSVAAALIAAQNGARILRVHDVGPTVDALKVMMALQKNLERE